MHRNNEIKIIILKKENKKRIGKGEKTKTQQTINS